MAIKQAVKKGTMARNRQAKALKANRAAQGQGLFSADRSTRRGMKRAIHGGKTQMSDVDMANAYDMQKGIRSANGQRIGEIDDLLGTGQGVSKSDRLLLQRERQGLMDQAMNAKSEQQRIGTAMEKGESLSRDLTKMERLGLAGKSIGNYYVGGTMGQSAARIGATTGGIVGLNMGMDYLSGGR